MTSGRDRVPTERLNLRVRFGRRYKVRHEESYHAEHGASARVDEPWLLVLLCRYGEIFPWGGDRLAASVDGHPMPGNSSGYPAAGRCRMAISAS